MFSTQPHQSSALAVASMLFSITVASSKPATAPPHAFIRYTAPAEGDTGLRLAVKDLIDVKGMVTTAGSHYLAETAKPAAADAACLRLARKQGVTIVGKTNLSEFAVGVTGSNDYFGTAVNPIQADRVPGGSSSGSAVAVALGLADVALGTDSGGSVRVPAACCGVAGLKTTFGLVPIEGIHPVSPEHLDTVGPIAKDVAGLVEGMALLQEGFEKLYEEAKAAKPNAKTIRIGRLKVPETDPVIDIAIDILLLQKGFEVVELDDAFVAAWQQAEHDGNIVAAAGAWSTHKDLRHKLRVSARAKEAILLGELEHLIYTQALDRKEAWQAALRRVLADVDAIALPVLRETPPEIHRLELHAEFEAHMLKIQNTVAINFAGNPALAIPVPIRGSDFPVTSIQFVGPRNGEAALLNIGRLAETQIGGGDGD